MPFSVGVISDTHGLLRPQALERLAGVDHIIHAGDIGEPGLIALLRKVAPVTAVRGNVDTDEWANKYPERAVVSLEGRTFCVVHDLNQLGTDAATAGYDVVVSGHSHQPKIESVGGVLYLNPGSAGPQRFRLPISLAIVELADGEIRPQLQELRP